MNYRYKHLSPVYAGDTRSRGLTLNTSYFQELFFNNYNLNLLLPFTQRIPVTGFFSELIYLENSNFKFMYLEFIEKIKQKIFLISNEPSLFRETLNHMNILVRYGICNLPEIKSANMINMSIDLILELALIQVGARANEAVSNQEPVAINDFIKIANESFNRKDIHSRLKILSGNRLIVTAYRFSKNQSFRKYARKILPELLLTLETLPNDFMNQLYKSITYRGIAMVHELGVNVQTNFLFQAEHIARSLVPENPLEKIVYEENLYTLLQTLSKWRNQAGNFQQAKIDLQEMISLDPYDSTAYSEMGFLLSEQQHYEEASIYFKKAADLGPPSVGMNLYYYAKCSEKMNEKFNIAEVLHEVLAIDPESISALLDLVGYYEKMKEIEKLRKIAEHILSKQALVEQLDQDEKQKVQNILHI